MHVSILHFPVSKDLNALSNKFVIFMFLLGAAVSLQFAITNPTNLTTPEYLYIPFAFCIIGVIVYFWSLF